MLTTTMSTHVRCEDPQRVIRSIREDLALAGYEETEERPPLPQAFVGVTNLRSIYVCEPQHGWIAVIDSELGQNLADVLSEDLDTHVLDIPFAEGSAWKYQLFSSGRDVDLFNSESETAFVESKLIEPWRERISRDGLAATRQHAVDCQRQMPLQEPAKSDSIPAEIRDGSKLWHAILSVVNGPPPTNQDIRFHVAQLRDIVRPEFNDDHVADILCADYQTTIDALEHFLPVVGISTAFLNINYATLTKALSESADVGVRVAACLSFENDL